MQRCALISLIAVVLTLGCGELSIIDSNQMALPSAIPHAKEDNFLSVSAREYLVEGEAFVKLDDFDADLAESTKLKMVKRLIPYKQIAITWFLNAWISPKDGKDANAKYGGFNALTKNASMEDLDIRKIDDITYAFTLRQEMGGPVDLMTKLPAFDNGDGTWSFDLTIGLPTNDEIQNLTAGDEWFRQKPWKHFNPAMMSMDKLSQIRLTVTRQPRSLDAWPEYARLFEDGKVTVAVHFGWDYHTAAHLSDSKKVYNWLVKQGYSSPVSDYEQLTRSSGPLKRTITAGDRQVRVEISLFWGKPGTNTDTDTNQGGKQLKKDMIKSLETKEVIIYSGHSGPFWGFSMGNWKKTEEGELDDNEIADLSLPSYYQVVLAEGCETYALGSAFYANPAKTSRTNLDIITTTTYSTAIDGDPVKDFLSAIVGTTSSGAHLPVTYGELMRDLDWNAWDAAMYGVHGIDDNPHIHPYAEPGKFCAPCSSDWDCGADWNSNFCLDLGTDGRFCAASCTGDDGCPEGYSCAAVARDSTITGRACVPENFSCTSDVQPTQRVIINELLADPPNDPSGDLNEDGWYDTTEDEFIELVNPSSKAIDLSGWTIADDTKVRFTFPQGVQLPGRSAVVVFGGGDPSALGSTGALLFVAKKGLRLANKGDTIVVRSHTGAIVDRVFFGAEGNNDRSLTRQVDGKKSASFIQHPGTPASPGTRSDGTLF
jgi:hypothetical protein